jgi:hypothetical protein
VDLERPRHLVFDQAAEHHHVTACRERLTHPCGHDGAHVVIGGEHPPDRRERVVHLLGDGVERFGAVDAHHVDIAPLLDQQPRGEFLITG